MRLTADLIQSSLSYINPLTERELDLRGHKIPAIENLGVARDYQDAIDLTDNDISILSNFPLSPRLRSLTIARNRVAAFHPITFVRNVPNLTTLGLAQNRVAELADLDALGGFKQLTHLVLIENPACAKEHYRYWVIWRCPSVRYLDFQRVRDPERKRATELFGTLKEPTELAQKIASIKSRTAFDSSSASAIANATSTSTSTEESSGLTSRLKLTEKEKKRVEQMIKNAKSMQEIARIEKELSEGRIPGGIGGKGGDVDMEG